MVNLPKNKWDWMKHSRIFLDSYWDGDLPVNLGQMCVSAKIDVVLDENVSCCLVDVGDRKISVNPNFSIERTRFCIAHGIGHIELGHYGGIDDISDYGKLGTCEQSYANRFAINILVPPHILKYVVGVKGVVEIKQLQSMFCVSGSLMNYQIENTFN